MNKHTLEPSSRVLEARLTSAAHEFAYPATPNIAKRVKQQLTTPAAQTTRPSRRLAWVTTIVGVILVALLLIPPVRTVIFEVVRQGVVRVFLLEPIPTLTITPMVSAEAPATASPSSLATPRLSTASMVAVVDIIATPVATQQVSPPVLRSIRPAQLDITPQAKSTPLFY
jgi:hypothetical protein